MGFERLCMALQGKTSNYDTDVFTPLIDKIALEYCGIQAFGIQPENFDKIFPGHIDGLFLEVVAEGPVSERSTAPNLSIRIIRR